MPLPDGDPGWECNGRWDGCGVDDCLVPFGVCTDLPVADLARVSHGAAFDNAVRVINPARLLGSYQPSFEKGAA